MTIKSSLLLLFCLAPFIAAAESGPSRPGVARKNESSTYELLGGKGKAQLLLNPRSGSPEGSLNLLELEVGAQVPEHAHESSAELLYVLSGRVEMTINGERLTAEAGDAIHIPAGAKHSARAVASAKEPTAPFRAVQVYVGPGPEERFRQGKAVPSR